MGEDSRLGEEEEGRRPPSGEGVEGREEVLSAGREPKVLVGRLDAMRLFSPVSASCSSRLWARCSSGGRQALAAQVWRLAPASSSCSSSKLCARCGGVGARLPLGVGDPGKLELAR